ncbi:MAG: hypothetical protein GC162_02935 [Planctomycetes bacterium]|nr:hypothetical protein [Planctomycetota bacterium]
MRNRFFILTLILTLTAGTAVHAVQLQDLVRIKGAESSRILGMGLVVGLNGTGDGGKSATTMRRLAAMMNRLGDPVVTAAELKDAKNVAVVYVTAVLPSSGVREGDRIDVQISAPMASSLKGGQLVMTPLLGPVPGSPVFAFASGPIVVENPDSDRVGVVTGGATLTRDVFAQFMDNFGRMTLVIDPVNATWPMANTITTLVNDEIAPDQPQIAFAQDQKNIVIQIPANERTNPSAFIARVLEIHVDPKLVRTEARVVINERTGTIVMTDNVQISPVVISHKGLTITTITPAPVPTSDAPVVDQKSFIGIDPSNQGGARLADLLAAFNQLKVPAEDRIAILKEIHRSGKLHAQLILEQ